MMAKLLSKERRANRSTDYDYSQVGYYFVTLCTKNEMEYFGEIENSKIILNEYGRVAERYWKEISIHYENIEIDDFIIMPNHIHGIIVIKGDNVGTEQRSVLNKTERCSVSTNTKNYGLLSKIVKSFKDAVTKTIHHNCRDYTLQWQRSFYDHIIRDKLSLHKIREYIATNPLRWDLDRNEIDNLLM